MVRGVRMTVLATLESCINHHILQAEEERKHSAFYQHIVPNPVSVMVWGALTYICDRQICENLFNSVPTERVSVWL